MAKLTRNVHVPDHGWFGPAHDNAENVPDEVAALITNPVAWDEAPIRADAPPQPEPDSAGDLSELIGASLRTEADEAQTALQVLTLLDAVPNDKDALLRFAGEHHLEVDQRKGPAKLREEIRGLIS